MNPSFEQLCRIYVYTRLSLICSKQLEAAPYIAEAIFANELKCEMLYL
jgi:hypothetical protein